MYPIHFSCFLFSFHTFRSVLILFRLLYISIWFMAHLNQRSTKKSWKKRPAKNKQHQQQYHEVAKQKLREENERRTIHVYIQKIRSVHRHSVVALLPSWSPVFFFSFSSLLFIFCCFFFSSFSCMYLCVFFFVNFIERPTQMRWNEIKTWIKKWKRNAESLWAKLFSL